MGYWTNKRVLITGGSAGLGFALADAFAAAGARVAIVSREEIKLTAAAERLQRHGGEVYGAIGDVSVTTDVERVVAETVHRFEGLDCLVNNAAVSMRGELLHTPLEEFRRLHELNVLSVVRGVQFAGPHLIASRGQIINIGSLAAKCGPRWLGAYPASKHAVAALSQQLRLELGPLGVSTLLVCPGPIRRDDAGHRYDHQAAHLPEAARRPGGGAPLKSLDPAALAVQILRAAERRQAELVLPGKARWLFALSQLWPSLGDWLLLRATRSEEE
jgi:NAD(P)-dependent dehydrogenase (short-subunit alcohol dehydrogenase family)